MTGQNSKLSGLKIIARRYLNFDFCILNFELPRGFTIIELVIAVGLFSVITTAAVGLIIGVTKAQQKISATQNVLDNIRFSLELITKEMRTGANYELTTLCASSGREIRFQGTSGWRLYYLQNNKIMRIAQTGPITSCSGDVQFTADEVLVNRLNFQLWGQVLGRSDGQPRVTISLDVRSTDPRFGPETTMNLQTSVTQRIRDIVP